MTAIGRSWQGRDLQQQGKARSSGGNGGDTHGRVTARQGRVPEPSALFTIACASLTIAFRCDLLVKLSA